MGSRCRRRRSISSNPASAKPKGNFPPRKPLKFLETRKESRTRRYWSASPRRNEIRPAERTEAFRSPASRRERLTANGVARKWRRNGLKRLNPRREMVWARKPRTYKIWYPGARLTVRLRLASRENEKLQKKAPYALKSLDAELKSAPAFRRDRNRPGHVKRRSGAGRSDP